jgi:protein gp37
MGKIKYMNDGDPRTSGEGFGLTVHEDALELPKKWKRPRLIFVNSMSDLFHARVPIGFVKKVFDVMADTPQHTYQVLTKRSRRLVRIAPQLRWSDNIWMGVSVEDMDVAFRIDDLRKVPAFVRFVSAEPLIGSLKDIDLSGIQWVIAGGESGAGARPIDIEWVRELRDHCSRAEIAFFFKQWGGRTPKSRGRTLDSREWNELPMRRQLSARSS